MAALIATVSMLATALVVLLPWLAETRTFGFHDWDVQTSHRYLVVKSLLDHHELPFWNPYACGGFPAWGYVEAGTILVSPWLPAYLALPMNLAIRVEVLGMALLGAAGAYAAGSRFTKSHGARALVAALFAVNGRWALQTASGHTWHLAYAFLPWALFFFERARQRPHRPRDLVLLGATFAALVYAGGIYPLPHTVLALGFYAIALGVLERSARPLAILGISGLLGVSLSAPKLLPMLDVFGKAPRLVPSTEAIDMGALFTMLTAPDQGFHSRPVRVPAYGWHEWGMYIGLPGVLLLLFGLLLVQGKREAALKVVGAIFGLLGLGAFHPHAPWTLLHAHVPVFKSQHVPSRFLYPAVLLLAIVAASGIGRIVERAGRRRPWLDAALAVLVLLLGLDVAKGAQRPMAQSMWMVPPDHIPADRPFHFEKNPPFHYKRRDWAGPMYLAMLGNTGVLDCYGAPPFERKGALAANDPRHRGEVFVAEGKGTARLVEWSPNKATITIEGAEAGAVVVYNMNYDEGWRASAGEVENLENRVAVRLPAGVTTLSLWYRPPGFLPGLFVGLAALAGAIALVRAEKREEEGEVRG
ncbi:hypothetical protein [Polyangium spumosum]|uniref:YfhO family protein n=1 Tax=Polyangium spumosum TaxID=889282 RepID=A0A6N7PIN5_9BACT|nr:hypothetical protein [Polyangium spumosum]MRG90686.1 hypothetical protein [Polyangium spumosum]